uniref:NUDIX domain-containing protein n=1 Tax=Nocardia brasiliensis TaxID=37326 RepID=UPI003D780960
MTTRHLVDAHVLLIRDGRLLLSKRRGADEFDGRWHLPAGKVEVGESATPPGGRAATDRMPPSSSSGPTSLPRNPLAPARRAWATYSSSSKVVRISTLVRR